MRRVFRWFSGAGAGSFVLMNEPEGEAGAEEEETEELDVYGVSS